MMGFGLITTVLIIAVIAFVIGQRPINSFLRSNTNSNKNALDILKERYASGEISKAEFEDMRKEL